MEVILEKTSKISGTRGEVVKVAPRLCAQFPAAEKAGGGGDGFEQEDRGAGAPGASAQGSEAEVGEAQELAKLVGAVTVTIARKAGENDQLFGSVTAADIADALTAKSTTSSAARSSSKSRSGRWASTKLRSACIAK